MLPRDALALANETGKLYPDPTHIEFDERTLLVFVDSLQRVVLKEVAESLEGCLTVARDDSDYYVGYKDALLHCVSIIQKKSVTALHPHNQERGHDHAGFN